MRKIVHRWFVDQGDCLFAYALCDDGTFWYCTPFSAPAREWVRFAFPEIPQD